MSTFLHYVHCKDALLDCSAPGGERCESLTWVDEILREAWDGGWGWHSCHSVRVSRGVPPFRPHFFTSGTPCGWVYKCQKYSCWVSVFRFEPFSLSNICEIFIFSHPFRVIFCEKLILRLGLKFTLRILRLGWNFTPQTPHPYPFWGEVPPNPPQWGTMYDHFYSNVTESQNENSLPQAEVW